MRILLGVLLTSVLMVPLATATSAATQEPLSEPTVLDHPAVTTTGRGATVAVWARSNADGSMYVLEGRVRPRGGAWGPTSTIDSWAAADAQAATGRPTLVPVAHGRALVAWTNGSRHVATSAWRPGSGWSQPATLSDTAHSALNPLLVSSPNGRVAMSWQQRGGGRLHLYVGVRRSTGWVVRELDDIADGGTGRDRAPVGIDRRGNVAVAWYHLVNGDATAYSSRLAAGRSRWQKPHLVDRVGEYQDCCFVGLFTTPAGRTYVSDSGKVWVRDGGGRWHRDLRVPAKAYAQRWVLADGRLFTWDTSDVHTRRAGGGWDSTRRLFEGGGLDTLVADPLGHAAAIDFRPGRIVVSLRRQGGGWTAPHTVAKPIDGRRAGEGAATIDGRGRVTVTWVTRTIGGTDDRVDSLTFSAVP